jgi:hypothetical protein
MSPFSFKSIVIFVVGDHVMSPISGDEKLGVKVYHKNVILTLPYKRDVHFSVGHIMS